jgi:MFS family permease
MQAPAIVSTPGVTRIRAILFIAQMAPAMGHTALQSLLPAIARESGISDTMIVTIFSLSAFTVIFSSVFWARQSDRIGRKPIIMVGLSGFAASMLGLACMIFVGTEHLAAPWIVFVGLLLARGIHGLIGAAAGPASQAYVADITAPAHRTHAMAVQASAVGLGTILGPAISPFLVMPGLGLSTPLAVFAFWAICMMLFVGMALPRDRRHAPHAEPRAPVSKLRLREPTMAPFAAFALGLGVATTIASQTLGFLIIDRLHLSPIVAQGFTGTALMAGAIAGVFGQWGLIRIFRLSPHQLLILGPMVSITGNVVLIATQGFAGIVCGFALSALGDGLGRPGYTAGASLAARPEHQGQVAGRLQSSSVISIIFAPVLGVTLYHWFHAAGFLLNILLLSGLLVLVARSRVLRGSGRAPVPDEVAELAPVSRLE